MQLSIYSEKEFINELNNIATELELVKILHKFYLCLESLMLNVKNTNMKCRLSYYFTFNNHDEVRKIYECPENYFSNKRNNYLVIGKITDKLDLYINFDNYIFPTNISKTQEYIEWQNINYIIKSIHGITI